jgi:hypothetical protein
VEEAIVAYFKALFSHSEGVKKITKNSIQDENIKMDLREKDVRARIELIWIRIGAGGVLL